MTNFGYLDGSHFQYSFAWDVDVSLGDSPNNLSTAAVIDGSSLLLTPFLKLVVPPPMSAAKIDVVSNFLYYYRMTSI